MSVYDEAVEVRSEDSLKDLELFALVSQEIRKIMEQVATLKAKTPDKWKESVQELRIEGSLHFLTLKKLNRIAQIRCKNAKDDTMEAKHKLDGNNLRLQNLQYEISHLGREINNCLQFKSKHEEIDLVDISEFYEQAPERVSKPEITQDNEHLQMLARLDWELESRKCLDKELKATHETKENMLDRIKKRKQDLGSLKPNLETILKSTMPLQEALGDHFTETRALNDNAYLLPQSLYVLFVQSKAFTEACDKNIEAQIGGDLQVATKLKNLSSQKVIDATNVYRDDDESDSETEEDQENQSTRRRSTSVSVAFSDRVKSSQGNTAKHPLYVSLKIFLEAKSENSPYLLLRFFHYSDPDFVTVTPSLELSTQHSNIKNSITLSSKTLLHDLQGKDSGRDLPEWSGSYPKVKLADTEQGYRWAQKLTGLDAMECGGKESYQEKFSNMRLIIRLIRHRINSRLSLADQLSDFERGSIRCDQTVTESYAPVVSFSLTSWKAIDFAAYSALNITSTARELGLVDSGDNFFIASIKRGTTACADVAISVPNQYPRKWPVIAVNLRWRGDHSATNDLNIREIEVEINCRIPESIFPVKKFRNGMLSIQLYRLLSMLDVYVETGTTNDGDSGMPSEFPTTKLCPRVAKGKSRLKPYKYNSRYKFQCY